MRHFFLSAFTLVMSSSFLYSETFYDRFKILEDKVQELSFEIDNLKAGTPDSVVHTEKSDRVRRVDTPKTQQAIDTMQSSIRSLEFEQREVIKQLLLLKAASRKSEAQLMPIAARNQAVKKVQKAVPQTKGEDDGWSDDESEDKESELASEIEDIQTQLLKIRRESKGNHIKVSADFRTSLDSIGYTMADGTVYTNDALFTNRLWLDFKYKATQNSSFTSELAYFKSYGQLVGAGNFAALSGFDWVTNTRPSDDTVRIKKAYWFYQNNTFLGTPIPWTFSLGRRPSTNGHLINLRDDDTASSPLAHFVNVEFDGGSSKFDFSELTGIKGLYTKFCFGRGQTNAQETFSSTPYATQANDLKQIDMVGLIVSLYDDKQYALKTQIVQAWNLIDLNSTRTGFETVGDISNITAHAEINGIGHHWSKFLDKSVFFASYSLSNTAPHPGHTMLGSATAQIGSSYWIGLQLPALSRKGSFGLEFNHGDKYWRSMTYAEDTLIGSKIAARGDAYEAYWTEYFDEALSFQLRYTYIDYAYSGSNGFFGGSADGTTGTGTPFTMAEALANMAGGSVVDKASDLRFYLRYRY